MNGSSLPYHLRTNKAIDRKIFFDLLGHLSSVLPQKIQEYKYVSLGGPMLEDHHILHHELGMTKLYSIEKDSAALSRQAYNKPFACIECIEGTTKDYIQDFDEAEPVIIWLDFTKPSWGAQFTECSDLLDKLKVYDVLKVTFNANPDVLNNDSAKTELQIFKDKANHPMVSENITENDVKTMPNLASTISTTFKAIAERSLSVQNLVLFPLLQFRYVDDRHQMLTITGIVLNEEDEEQEQEQGQESHSIFAEKLSSHLSVVNWPYLNSDWDIVEEINVPDLTVRERYELDRRLPISDGPVHLGDLPFRLDRNDVKSQKMLDNYIKYYRYIPRFLRVAS